MIGGLSLRTFGYQFQCFDICSTQVLGLKACLGMKSIRVEWLKSKHFSFQDRLDPRGSF
jgi:hypothetical protein